MIRPLHLAGFFAFSLSTLVFRNAAEAQIPNGGFENWNTDGGYEDPDGWITQNEISSVFSVLLCEKGTPGNPGASYMKLTTKSVGPFGVMPASLTSGVQGGPGNPFGFPMSTRPDALTGFIKHMQPAADTSLITIAFTKWNTITQERESIGAALGFFTGAQTTWQPLNMPITYGSPLTPDTAVIIMLSTTSPTPDLGSYIYLDDLGFDGGSGVQETTSNDASLEIRPSLASTEINVQGHTLLRELTIWTVSGGLVMRETANEQLVTLGIESLDPAVYVLKATMSDGSVAVQRFVKR
jgi:hypothetical protein